MIRADMIPDEVVEAAAMEDYEAYRDINEVRDLTLPWDDISDDERQAHREGVRRSIAAALNAWPFGAVCHYMLENTEGWELVLPLPQEARETDWGKSVGKEEW